MLNSITCSLVAYELLCLSHLLQRKINSSEGFRLDSRASASAIVRKCDGVVEVLDYSLKPLDYTQTQMCHCSIYTAIFGISFFHCSRHQI